MTLKNEKAWQPLFTALLLLSTMLSTVPLADAPTMTPTTPTATPVERNIPIATEFYIWYGFDADGNCQTGLGSSHWNDTRDRVVVIEPEAGFYCSADKSIIVRQLAEIKSVGINVLIVSWWNDAATSRALGVLMQTINETKGFASWFKVAVLVEVTDDVYDQVWNWIYASYDDLMFVWHGKPLLVFFNQPKPNADSRFTVRTLGVHYSPDWVFWKGTNLTDKAEGFNASEYQGNPVISTDGVVTVTPRFDDYYLHLSGSRPYYQRYDPNLTQGMYEHEWKYVIQHRSEVRLVIVNSFNEWHELNAIEPSKQDGCLLLSMTQLYVDQFEKRSVIGEYGLCNE